MSFHSLPAPQRIAAALWVVIGIVVWNGIFEMQVVRGVKEYLFHAALSGTGRGPVIPIEQIMDPAIYDAMWIATLWASSIVLAGLLTLRLGRPLTASRHSPTSEPE